MGNANFTGGRTHRSKNPTQKSSGNSTENGRDPAEIENLVVPSVLDAQTPEFQIRAMNGRLTPREVRSLPDTPLPLPYAHPRDLNATVDVVARAIHERFRTGICADCGGTTLYSKRRPLVRCTRCGTCLATTTVMPVATRRKCKQCGTYFRSVTKFLRCEPCRTRPVSEEPSPTKIIRQSSSDDDDETD